MAEFQEVMKQWKRICNAVPGKAERLNLCSDKKSGYVCPLRENGLCNRAIEDQSIEDWKEGEHIIMAWAAENPEPKYPTWWKYLCMIGVIPDELGDKTLGEMTVYSLMNTHIQSDMAEKLGIEPK